MRFGMLILWFLVSGLDAMELLAQTGKVWTPEEIVSYAINPSRELQLETWPPHNVIGNVHYVGTRNLGAYLITTAEGHILINSTFEETLPTVRQSMEALGFQVEDIRIILGSHAHRDHMAGSALLKEWTGAEIMVMAEDVPLFERVTPEGTAPPSIDRVLHHEDEVTLGSTTLTAVRTPGHSPGTTTWVLTAEEDGIDYDVVILGGSVTPRQQLVGDPELQSQFRTTFEFHRSLECDVPLGPHTPMHRMEEKYAKLGAGRNPFIDPQGCQDEMSRQEQAFEFRLEDQRREQEEK